MSDELKLALALSIAITLATAELVPEGSGIIFWGLSLLDELMLARPGMVVVIELVESSDDNGSDGGRGAIGAVVDGVVIVGKGSDAEDDDVVAIDDESDGGDVVGGLRNRDLSSSKAASRLARSSLATANALATLTFSSWLVDIDSTLSLLTTAEASSLDVLATVVVLPVVTLLPSVSTATAIASLLSFILSSLTPNKSLLPLLALLLGGIASSVLPITSRRGERLDDITGDGD